MPTRVTVVAALTSSVLVFALSPAFAQPRQSPETTHPTFTPPPASLLSHAVIGVGGLAGVGETTVVVRWSDLRIQPDPTNPRRTITTVDQTVVDRAPRWDRRAEERDRVPPAASPTTIPPGPASPLTPGRQELWSGLRKHGVEHVGDVKAAYLEGDGELTVFRRGQQGRQEDNDRHARRRAVR
jgi:hypothetical protein